MSDTYVITTTRWNRYTVDANGYVLARSNGPDGWDYGNGWRILGAATRANANAIRPIADCHALGIPGQGWIHDLDHGTHRMWGNERMRSVHKVTTDA